MATAFSAASAARALATAARRRCGMHPRFGAAQLGRHARGEGLLGQHRQLLLDRLELADRLAELRAVVGVLQRHRQQPLQRAGHQRGGDQRAGGLQVDIAGQPGVRQRAQHDVGLQAAVHAAALHLGRRQRHAAQSVGCAAAAAIAPPRRRARRGSASGRRPGAAPTARWRSPLSAASAPSTPRAHRVCASGTGSVWWPQASHSGKASRRPAPPSSGTSRSR